MKFGRKIYLGWALITLAILPLVLVSFISLKKIVNEQNVLVTINARSVLLVERLLYISSVQSSMMPLYVLSGEKDFLAGFDKQKSDYDATLDNLRRIESNPTARDLIAEIQRQSDAFYLSAEPGVRLKREGYPQSQITEYFKTQTRPLAEKALNSLVQLSKIEAHTLNTARKEARQTGEFVVWALMFFSVMAFALLGLSFWFAKRIIRQRSEYDRAQQILLAKECQLSRARKETVEVVAHDLQNPLATMKMSLEICQELVASDSLAELKNYLAMSQRQVFSMQALISDLLDHSKVEADNLVLNKKPCELGSMLSKIGQSFEILSKSKGIEINTLDFADAVVDCDLGRMEQVLANLIGNALKFSPAQSRIEIRSHLHEDGVVISVKDAGPGMAAEQAKHIFERFWQVRETAAQGTGLGLAIAKAIVEAHHGKIWVESELGAGSTFYVSLPVVRHSVIDEAFAQI